MGTYPSYPKVLNFFRLRPELTLSLIAYILLFAMLFIVRWSESEDTSDFLDLTKFEMIELKIPETAQSEPDISLPEDDIQEENKMPKFGDDSGKFNLSAMAVTPPKPKISSLPAYPESMKKAGVEGVVVLEVGIDENGTIVYGKVVKSLHPILDRMVINWVKYVSFYPAINAGGKAFRCKIFWPIRFQLHD